MTKKNKSHFYVILAIVGIIVVVTLVMLVLNLQKQREIRVGEAFQIVDSGLILGSENVINLNNYPIMILHIDNVDRKGNFVKPETKYFAIINNKQIEIVIENEELQELFSPYNQQGIIRDNKIYVNVDPTKIQTTSSTSSAGTQTQSSITGAPVYNPPTPFNQRSMNVGVLVPYNTAYPLPSYAFEWDTYLQPILDKVKQFYLDNSEDQTLLTFTLHSVFMDTYNADTFPDSASNNDIISLINYGDPSIDYSLYDFVLIVIYSQNNPLGGGATRAWDYSTDTPVYYQTNDGPLASAVPFIVERNIFWITPTDPNYPYSILFNAFVINHEIGHELAFWNPQATGLVYNAGVPHANGISDPSQCEQKNQIILCNAYEYGDYLNTMGTGKGAFHYHYRSFFMGLSPTSNVQTISSSGTYDLCDINNVPSVGCPQEILIENPVGNNIALELRTNTDQELLYGCPDEYFDGVLIRVTDIEEGGGLGNIVYKTDISQFVAPRGDILLAADYSTTYCPDTQIYYPNVLNFPLKKGQTMNTPLADITVESITNLPTGGKQARVNVIYKTLSCVPASPTAVISPNDEPIELYSDTLQPVIGWPYSVIITNLNVCNTGSETFRVITQVPSVSGASAAVTTQSINSLETSGINLPIPQALQGQCGFKPYTVTIHKVLTPLHRFTLSGNFRLVGGNCPTISSADNIQYTLVDFCDDSDGGRNYGVRGTARDATGGYTDNCIDNLYLREYYCDGLRAKEDLHRCGDFVPEICDIKLGECRKI